MSYSQLIRDTVTSYIANGIMFTSVDIANKVKETKFIGNHNVADWLRVNAIDMSHELHSPYVITIIDVFPLGVTGSVKANLYHPVGSDPNGYVNIDQEAIPPTDDQLEELEADSDEDDGLPHVPCSHLSTPASGNLADRLGRIISVGNIVCYPVRQGSSMWMNDIEVTHIDIHLGSIKGKLMIMHMGRKIPSNKIVTIRRLSRVTKIS